MNSKTVFNQHNSLVCSHLEYDENSWFRRKNVKGMDKMQARVSELLMRTGKIYDFKLVLKPFSKDI